MTLLRIRLPETAPVAEESYAWATLDERGALCDEGRAVLGRLPPARRVELVAPAARVLLTRIVPPKRGGRRLRRILPYAVEDRLMVEPERVHAALGPREADGSYAVAVVERDWLGQWLAALRAVDRAVDSVRVETCLPPIEADTWTIVWSGEDSFVRTRAVGGMALDGGSRSAPPFALALALREAHVAGDAPTELRIRAATAEMPDLAEWSAALGVPCEPAERFEWAAGTPVPVIDLLQGDFSPVRARRRSLAALRPALILAAIIVAIHVMANFVHWGLLHRERSRLQAEMRGLFQTAFPEAKAIVDPSLQMRRQLDDLRRAAGESRPDDFMPLLADVSAAIAGSGAAVRVRSVSYERSRMLLDVEIPDREAAGAILRRLQAAPLSAALDAVNTDAKGVLARFTIAAKGGT